MSSMSSMSRAARTVHLHGIYLAVTGLTLIVIPNVLLGVLSIPRTDQPWIRILGLVVLALAYFHVVAARNELTAYLQASVVVRVGVGAADIVIVALWGYWLAVAFGIVDIASALWTRAALAENQPAEALPA